MNLWIIFVRYLKKLLYPLLEFLAPVLKIEDIDAPP